MSRAGARFSCIRARAVRLQTLEQDYFKGRVSKVEAYSCTPAGTVHSGRDMELKYAAPFQIKRRPTSQNRVALVVEGCKV